jgi:hypothetical protein
MDGVLSNPSAIFFLGTISVGPTYARCLITVFIILAFVLAGHQIWRMRRQLRLLDEAAKARDAQATAGIEAPNRDPKRDVWSS